VEVLRENPYYLVELDEDTSLEHQPHRSWGTYRVVERASKRVIYSTPNRDKSFGVFEYLAQEAGH
jgi:hypothetical protein